MWKCASTNGGARSCASASIVNPAAALMLRATLTIRPCATSTSTPVRPSGNVALRMSRSAIYVLQQQVPRFTRDDIRGQSLGSEYAIAGVAQSGQDVAVIVQLPVDCRRVNRHVRMRVTERAHAFGTRNETHEANRARVCFLEPIDRRDGGMAGGEHRIEH